MHTSAKFKGFYDSSWRDVNGGSCQLRRFVSGPVAYYALVDVGLGGSSQCPMLWNQKTDNEGS